MDEYQSLIEDIIYQLEQMSYSQELHILKILLKAYSMTFVSKTVLEQLMKYKLQKDYKPKDINEIKLSPVLIEKIHKIDKEQILTKQFGDSILNFINTIIEKIPHANVNILCNNLNNLKIKTKNLKIINFFCINKLLGYYSSKNNTIVLKKDEEIISLYHELFHMATSIFKKCDNINLCGFSQVSLKKNRSIGNAINEGYTQFLTERYFGEDIPAVKGSYSLEINLVENLETIVGKEKMESLYFKADLYGLVNELKKYDNEENIMKFITETDFLNRYFRIQGLLTLEREMIEDSFNSVNRFLIKCYAKKIKLEIVSGLIDDKLLEKRLETYNQLLNKLCIMYTENEIIKYKPITNDYNVNILNEIFDIDKVLMEFENNTKLTETKSLAKSLI